MSIEAVSENSSCNLEACAYQEEPTTDSNGHTLNEAQIDPRIKKMQKHIHLLR